MKYFTHTVKIIALIVLFFITGTQTNAQLQINSVYGNMLDCDTMTRSIYIVWWDKDFNYNNQVDVMLDSMVSYRNTCLDELLMVDPPNTDDGYFYNVYIHTPGNSNDIFYPLGWGNGQGTDSNGYPFLTLPNGTFSDFLNTSHETFHIFQYNANSPGFAYSGDSQWYIEATANWFAARENITAPRAFVEAESLVRVPHVPLWLSYGNYPFFYPSNWQRYVHQYALALLLYYLTDVAGVPENTLTEGFFNGTIQLPQEYLFYQLGADTFREHFIGWAAHMTNDFDFIEPYQAAVNENEWNSYADPWDDNEFTQTFTNSGIEGWYQPADSMVTTAWSFNTYKLINTTTGSYTFELDGDETGSFGDDAFFQGMVVIQNSISGTSFHELTMINDYQGSLTLDASPADTEFYFIVASMPEKFEDNGSASKQFPSVFQLFPYSISITPGTTGIRDNHNSKSRTEVSRYNTLGQKVTADASGFQIILFDDGTVEKVRIVQ